MSKYREALDNLAKGRSNDKIKDYNTVLEIINFGEEYVGLNREWNKQNKITGEHNLTTKILVEILSCQKNILKARNDEFETLRGYIKRIVAELRKLKGQEITEELIEEIVFGVAITKEITNEN